MTRRDDGLRRRSAFRGPRQRIVVFCEGKTEAWYLNDMKSDFRSHLTSVEVHGESGKPIELVEKAVAKVDELRREGGTDSFGSLFQVWCMFDQDQHQGIPEAKRLAETQGVRVVHSNPCVEIWALYHFSEYNRDSTAGEVQKELRKHMPSFDHNRNRQFDYLLLRSGNRFENAVIRAERGLRDRERDGFPNGNPSTNLHNLLTLIRDPDQPLDAHKRAHKVQPS